MSKQERNLSLRDELTDFLLYTAPNGQVKVVGSILETTTQHGAIEGKLFPVWKQFNKNASEKSFGEYEKINKTQPLESDFDRMVKALPQTNKLNE